MDGSTESHLRAFAGERRYRSELIERWLALGDDDAGALLRLATTLRLSEHVLDEVWTWSADIACREGSTIAAVLGDDELDSALRAPIGRQAKIARVRAGLRRRRYPELSAAESRLAELVRELHLPASVRLRVPDFLEGGQLRLEIVAATSADLRATAHALDQIAQSPLWLEIFAQLGSA